MSDLPSTTSCYISTSCTDVRCCVEIPTLNNFTVTFTVSLDDCQKTLNVKIEKWTHTQMLHNYSWGTEEYFWVRGIYRVRLVLLLKRSLEWNRFRFMVFNATFNNISVRLWRSVLLVEETVVPWENHRPVACHSDKLYHIMYQLHLAEGMGLIS